MASPRPDQDSLKKLAAERAVELVQDGMVLGLGTGSTAKFAVDRIGERLKEGSLKRIVGVPTSQRTAEQAKRLGIPLSTLDDHAFLDLAIDGADEVDPKLNLVKGRGGALLREKMVETAARRFIVIVDESKLVPGLGAGGAMPVDVVQFCWKYTAGRLEKLGCEVKLRMEGNRPFVTDNGNYILDCFFRKPMSDPYQVAASIRSFTGVVDHGLFLDMASQVIVADKDGISVRERE
ncbi:MAG: ribose 5-phosphate isomerase A [Planctomycetes bacterium]|nr:ribose 5-phosphate isomerase A [Planctomycetota bacterium]